MFARRDQSFRAIHPKTADAEMRWLRNADGRSTSNDERTFYGVSDRNRMFL